jgi:hypothetical protein
MGFPTFGLRHERDKALPCWGRFPNFFRWRTRPIARKLGITDQLVTFQVMRPDAGNGHAATWEVKDTQGMLRHASIKTTGDVYVQTIEQSVLAAVNSRRSALLGDLKTPEKNFGLKRRNLKGLNEIRRKRLISEWLQVIGRSGGTRAECAPLDGFWGGADQLPKG